MDLYCEKWPKMTIFMRAERRKEWCHFHQTLSVISYDQNKYHGNYNFLSFEMPFILQKGPFWKSPFRGYSVHLIQRSFLGYSQDFCFVWCFPLISFEYVVRKTVIFKWKQPSVRFTMWYVTWEFPRIVSAESILFYIRKCFINWIVAAELLKGGNYSRKHG